MYSIETTLHKIRSTGTLYIAQYSRASSFPIVHSLQSKLM